MIVDRRLLAVLPLGLVVLAGCSDGSPAPVAATSPQPAPPAAAGPPPASAPAGQPLGTFTVTCHTGGGKTASGYPNGPGVAAVDTDVFPLGTKLQVEKVGLVTAADRGGAVDGKSLDVWSPTEQECTAFGRQQLKVWRVGS
jgi:3D (Asp-Asp-Asp) domain-containing protein